MSFLRALWYYLWIAPHALQAIIVVLMIRRRWYRQFPMFFLYNCGEIVQFAVLFLSAFYFHFDHGYFRFFSTGLAVSAAIRFGVIQELFGQFFQQYPSLSGPGRMFLRSSIMVLLLVAVGLTMSAPGTSIDFLLHATYALDRTASILQAGLLVSLFLFSRYFALSWRSQAFGIALGMGILASVDLARSATRLYGLLSSRTADFISMGIYHACVLIWMFYLTVAEPEPQRVLNALPEHDLDIWNRELQRLTQQ